MAKNIDLDEVRQLIVRMKKASGCNCCADTEELYAAEDELGELLGFDQYEDGSGYYLFGMPGTYVPNKNT